MRPLRSRPVSPRRAGITLTEILIAILIMGVGLISLATLFPLGLIRMQRAMRDSRSTLLARSAIAEVRDRDLLNGRSFGQVGWYNANVIDPWLSDSNIVQRVNGTDDNRISFGYLSRQDGTYTANQLRPGLPICYDPLWWAINDQNGTGNPATILGTAARFGCGIGLLRNDPADNSAPSAHGLQRITNFRRWPIAIDTNAFYQFSPYPLIYFVPNAAIPAITAGPDVASQVFGSPDNIVFNGEDQEVPNRGNSNAPSSLLPDMATDPGKLMFDLKYTWFFTGQRPNVQETGSYVGSIVVCENRVMGLETIGSVTLPQGERVYEAIWGYSGSLVKPYGTTGYGYGVGERTVLIRWPVGLPDPVLKSGSYIADVTYEPDLNRNSTRFANYAYAGQRCEWYRVAGTTTPETDPGVTNPTAYRRMIVTLESPVRAKTLVAAGGQAVHVNSALVMPSVINVIPQAFVTTDGK